MTNTINFGRSSFRVDSIEEGRLRIEVRDPTDEPTILDLSRDEYTRLLAFLREGGRFADEFPRHFEEAFALLDVHKRGVVSLHRLRIELCDYDREAFDQGLRLVCNRGRYQLDIPDRYQNQTTEETRAGIWEGPTLYTLCRKVVI